MARRTKWTEKKRAAFLQALRETGNATTAAATVGLARSHAFVLRREDADFARQWEEALEEAGDRLEAEAWRRAVRGVDKPIYQHGALVGRVREYSDTLLIFLLKGARPEKYKDRFVQEHTGPKGGAIAHAFDLSKLSVEQLRILRALLDQAADAD